MLLCAGVNSGASVSLPPLSMPALANIARRRGVLLRPDQLEHPALSLPHETLLALTEAILYKFVIESLIRHVVNVSSIHDFIFYLQHIVIFEQFAPFYSNKY